MAKAKKEAVETTETVKVEAQVQENPSAEDDLVKEPTNESCNQEVCAKLSPAKEFSESDAVAKLLVRFEAKEKPSENILVAIQHLEAVQKLLLKEAESIYVVHAKIVE